MNPIPNFSAILKSYTKTLQIYIISLVCVAISLPVLGQQVNSESFDAAGFPPTGWTRQVVIGNPGGGGTNPDVTHWSRVTAGTNPTASPHSGAAMAQFESSVVKAGGSVSLISPSFDLSGRGSNSISVDFWMYRDNGSSSSTDRIEVYVNTGTGITGATLLGTINRSRSLSPTESSDGWYEYSYNIPLGFNTNTNYLIFYAVSGRGNNMFIDDVEWESFPPNVPSVTLNPNSVLECSGQSVSFSSSASGAPSPDVQWQVSTDSGSSWADISGANSTTYTFTSTYSDNNNQYRAIFSNISGSDTSNIATLTLNPVPDANTGSNQDICIGGSVQIGATAVAGNTYSWSPATGLSDTTVSNPIANPTATTTYTLTETITATGCQNTASVTITVNPLPNVSISASANTICLGESSSLTASGASTYSWIPATGLSSTSGANVTASPTSTTTYIVSGIDGNGCENTDTIIITVNPLPNVSISASADIICLGESSSLTASGAGTYTWTPATGLSSTSGTNVTASPTSTTTYIVNGTDGNGCENTDTITITVNPLPSASTGSDQTICLGESVQIGAASVAGNTYSWTPTTGLSDATAANPTASSTSTTTYTLTETITATGCQNTSSVTVTVNPLPNVSVSASADVICTGESSSLTASGASTYTWSPATGLSSTSGANVTASPIVTTTYIVSGTDGNGCENTDTITITVNPLPSADAGSNETICLGESVQIGAASVAGNTYLWSPTTGLSDATASNPTANPTSTTVYTLTETITATGCQNTGSVTVTVNPLPASTTGSDQTICIGGSIQIGAASVVGNTYSWTPTTGLSDATASNPTANPGTTTVYTLTETITATGCQNTGSVTVTVNPLPNVSISASADVICLGESSSLTASGASTYTWTPATGLSASSGANVTASPTATTTYIVSGTDDNGCENTDTITITVNPLPSADAGSDQTICLGESVQIGSASVAGNTYLWSPATGLSNATASNPTANPTSTTVYTLTETITATGCQNTASVTVTVNPLPNVSISASADIICLGESSSLTASGASTYTWSPATGLSATSGANVTASPTSTTTYIVSGTDGNGCENTDTITITVNPLPSADAGSDETICLGESVEIGSASVAGNTYSWTPTTGLSDATASNPTANPTATTVYTLTETITATGCQNTASVTVTVNPLPAATTGSDEIICIGESVQIGAASVAGNTYSWTPTTGLSDVTASNPTANPTATTVYTLTETITATGCENTGSVTVTVNPLPNVSISASTDIICVGESSSLTASGAGTYTWSPATGLSATSGANVTASPTSTTTYVVSGTDGNGCENTDTITITVNPLPVADAGSNETICLGESVQIGAASVAGNTYSWTPTTGLSDATVSNPTANPTSTTVYTLTETITATGCQNTGSVTVTVNPLPAATTGSDQTICIGGSIQIGAASVAGNTYSWTPTTGLSDVTASNPTANPTATTVYTLTETITATGCQNTGSVTVTVNPLPSADAGSDETICLGESVQIGSASVAGNTYSWTPTTGLSDATASNPTTNPTATTVYTLTETITATGCQNTGSVTVTVNPLPSADAGSDETICSGESVQIGSASVAGNTYSWTPTTGLSDATASNPTANPTSTTVYTLTETITATGCQNTGSVTVTVNPLPNVSISASADVICTGESSNLTASGASTYTWTPATGLSATSGANVTASPTATTTYIVSGTDVNGCENTDTITITVNPLPSADAGSDETICLGESVQIGAASVAGNTYSWTPTTGLSDATASNPTANPTATTVYTLTETITATGCQNTGSVTVTVNPLPAANTGSDQTICIGGSVQIGAASVAGNTYSWTPTTGLSDATASNPTANPTSTTVYTLTETITATGCQNIGSATVNVQPAIANNSISAVQTICEGETPAGLSGTLPTGGDGSYNYLWESSTTSSGSGFSNASGTNNAQNYSPGSLTQTTWYRRTVSSGECDGAQGSISNVIEITVTPLVGNPTAPSGPISRCEGTGTSAYTTSATDAVSYTWSVTGSGNTISGSGTSATVSWDSGFSGTAIVSVVANNSCGSSDTATTSVTVNPQPGLPTDISGISSRCRGSGPDDLFTTSATDASSFTWSINTGGNISGTGSTGTVDWTNNFSGVSTITVVANNACGTSAPVQHIVTSYYNEPTDPTAPSGTLTRCEGSGSDIYTTSSTNVESYEWTISPASAGSISGTNDSASVIWNGSFNGTATISVRAINPCDVSIWVSTNVTVTPTVGTPTAPSGTTTLCQGATSTYTTSATDATSYNWMVSGAGNTISGTGTSATVNLDANFTGTAIVSVSANGCNGPSDTVQTSIEVTPTVGTPSVPSGIVERCQGSGSSTYTTLASDATSYNWSLNNTENTITGSGTSATIDWSSTYSGTITISVTANGCNGPSAAATLDVVVNPLPSADAGSDQTICNGLSAQIGAAAIAGNSYSWTPATGLDNANIANPIASPSVTTTYTLTETVDATSCEESNSVTITVLPSLANNNIGSDQTICADIIPNSLSGSAPTGGNGTYTYLWESSTTSASSGFASATGTNDGINYSPGLLSDTTWYRRIVSSAECSGAGADTSNIIQIIVQPVIGNNTISSDQTICAGDTPSGLSGTAANGGDGNYAYSWESSTTSSSTGFISATGTNNTQNYSPTALTQTTWYRRVVSSGSCNDTSNAIQITVNQYPEAAGIISGSTLVCQGQNGVGYSIPTIQYASGYEWTLPQGAYIVLGEDSDRIVVNFTDTAQAGVITVYGTNGCGSGAVSADLNISINPLPEDIGAISGTDTVCQGETGIGYSVPSVNYATGYQWILPSGASIASGASTNNITVDFSGSAVSGEILVFATNSCGNSDTAGFDIYVNSLPAAPGTITGVNAICPGGQSYVFSIDTIANISEYVWTVPSFATIITNPDSNVITVEFDSTATSSSISVYAVNDCGNGPSSTKTFTAYPFVYATAESNHPVVCETSGKINLLGKGSGFGNVTWSWTGPNGFTSGNINPIPFTATLAAQGWYTVVNTDENGCSGTASVYITVMPAPPAPTITADGPTTFCEGGSVTLISSTDTSYNSYLWSNGDTDDSTTVTTSGNYNVTVTGNNGCPISAVNSMPVTVNPLPIVTPGNDQTICYGQSTQIGASPQSNRSYEWSPAATLNDSTLANPTASPLDTTTYQLIVTNTATGCIDSNTMIVNVLPPIDSNIIAEAQTICSGQAPGQLTGSVPTGGNGSSYAYQWEMSSDNINFTAISGANGQNYGPSVLNDTTWYRRIASSGPCAGNEANTSNVIEISVLPSIDNNIIDADQTICTGQTPDPFTGSLPTGGNGSYNYQWQISTTSSSSGFANASGSSNLQGYTPTTAHTSDTWYRRIVSSGPCIDAQSDTSNIIEITILSIDNNIISTDQNICVGDTPSVLSGTLPTGGDGSFTYLWESSTTSASSGFSAATGTNTGQTYAPSGISQTTWYRRVVYSGPCTGSFGNESNVIQITASPISNNTLSVLGNPGPFCNSGQPTSIVGSQPTGASGSYTYQWQVKVQGNNYADISGANSINYIPPTLTSTTHYRRIVRSGNCEHISQKIVVVIQPSISNNNILADQTVCYNTAPDTLTGTIPAGGDSSYNFIWEYSYNTLTWIQIPGSNSKNYQPDSLTQKTYFRRSVTSGACNNPHIGNTLEVDVLPINRSIWTGNVDTDWNKPMNWQCGVPDYSTDVIIPVRPNQPHIFNGVLGKCNTYWMDNSTQLYIESGGRLNVKEPQ